MTFENGGSLQMSPSGTRKYPVSQGRMNRRAKLTKTLPVHVTEERGRNSHLHRKFETIDNSRRYSCPQAKSLISAVYREKPSPRNKAAFSDLSLTYPTPELNYLFSKVELVSNDDSENMVKQATTADATVPKLQKIKPLANSNKVSSPRGDHDISGAVASNLPHWGNTLLGMRSTRRFSLPVTTLEKQLDKTLTLVSHVPKEKNEAEIIEDHRRGSLEDRMAFTVPGAAALRLQGRNTGVGVGRSVSLKAGRGESLNRELRSHYMNSMQERKLRSACDDLDRQSYAGVLEYRTRQQQMTKQHAELLKRSPSTEDWMSNRKCRTVSLQEKERESISKRFSRRARHFRAPKALQDEVSTIRSVAMFHAGLYNASRSPPTSPAEAKMLLRRIATAAGGGGGGGSGGRSKGNSHKNSHKSEENGRRDDDNIITLVSQENSESHNSFESKNRKSVSGGETAAVLRQLHSRAIPPRVAESGLAGLLNHSRRMSLVGGPTMEDMLQALPGYLTGNDDSHAPASARGREFNTDQGVGSLSAKAKARDDGSDDNNECDNEEGNEDETRDTVDLSATDSDNDSDPFSDLDQISSDTDEEDDAFDEDRRNI